MPEFHAQIISRKKARELGIDYYFTGKPCKRWHFFQRYSSTGQCVECHKEYVRQYQEENREHLREKKRQWYSDNPDYNRKYRANNLDRIIENDRRYRAENRDRLRENDRQYSADNRERLREYCRQWRSENKEKISANSAKHRAYKLQRTLLHDEELTHFVMQEAQQHTQDMESFFGISFHVDHMIPMMGELVSGFHVWYNLQVVPAELNLSKHNRLIYTEPLEWLADCT